MIAHLYKITNNLTNQYYIGKRRGNEQGRYWGSGIRIKRHLKKYGKENFTYDILRVSNEEKIFKLEERLITNNYIKNNKLCLNLAPGGQGGFGNMPKDYMEGDKNVSKRPEVRARLSELLKNKEHPMIKLMRENNPLKGRKQPEELKRKVSESLKQTYKNGYKNWNAGKKMTEEFISKLRGPRLSITGKNNPFYGKTHSKEVTMKISIANTKRFNFISPDNKVYNRKTINVKNLMDFCKQMKLPCEEMYFLLKGKLNSFNGWRTA